MNADLQVRVLLKKSIASGFAFGQRLSNVLLFRNLETLRRGRQCVGRKLEEGGKEDKKRGRWECDLRQRSNVVF